MRRTMCVFIRTLRLWLFKKKYIYIIFNILTYFLFYIKNIGLRGNLDFFKQIFFLILKLST